MNQTPEGSKILNDENPVVVTIKVIDQLRERIETGEKFTGMSDENWEAIPDKVSFKFLRYLLSILMTDSWVGTHSHSDKVGPQGSPEIWRGCHLTLTTAKDTNKINKAVVEIPDNPVKIVFIEPHLKLIGLETATQEQIGEATKLIVPFKKRIKPGVKQKQIYIEAKARLDEGIPYDEVLKDVQNEDFEMSDEKLYAGVYRLGYRKRGKNTNYAG
jgi:hypothetical protein